MPIRQRSNNNLDTQFCKAVVTYKFWTFWLWSPDCHYRYPTRIWFGFDRMHCILSKPNRHIMQRLFWKTLKLICWWSCFVWRDCNKWVSECTETKHVTECSQQNLRCHRLISHKLFQNKTFKSWNILKRVQRFEPSSFRSSSSLTHHKVGNKTHATGFIIN